MDITLPTADTSMNEAQVGRMGNFNAGLNGVKHSLTPPKATKADITSDIK